MIDIHSHILWQLDDGSRSLEESVAMLRSAQAAGTTDIVASPHANQQYRFDAAIIAERIQELAQMPDLGIKIHRGCDFHLMYENIVDALDNPSKYTINGGPYLLAELPTFSVPASIDNVLERFVQSGLIPVITHPERNPVVCKSFDRLKRWVEMGCLIQVTAGSVSGLFGRSAKNSAQDLLRRRLVHVIASDAHDVEVRHPRLDEAHKAVANDHGEQLARELFDETPGAIIAGKLLFMREDESPRSNSRKWRLFGRRD